MTTVPLSLWFLGRGRLTPNTTCHSRQFSTELNYHDGAVKIPLEQRVDAADGPQRITGHRAEYRDGHGASRQGLRNRGWWHYARDDRAATTLSVEGSTPSDMEASYQKFFVRRRLETLPVMIGFAFLFDAVVPSTCTL